MRSQAQKTAHVLERLGLAMAGAAAGLFVAIHVGSFIDPLRSQAFLVLMTIIGAVGFYLGIDTPPQPAHEGKIDVEELFSAIGTFLAALAAFTSVGAIVARAEPHLAWTWAVLVAWCFGVAMQIVAGAIARRRAIG
jgi:hypothetical protein